MRTEALRNHFLGTVVGLCVGESLGAQFEGKAASMVQMLLEDHGLVYTGDKRGKLKPGEWTDDAGQFIAMMNSFNVTHGFEPLDAAGCLTSWIKHKPKRVGMHSLEIIRHLRVDLADYVSLGKEAWIRSAGVKAGNGSLARCLVPGLFYCHDLEKMIEATIGISLITHYDPRCIESALVMNFLLMECLNGRFNPSSVDYSIAFLQSIRQSEAYTNYMASFDPRAMMDYTNFSPYSAYNDDKDAVINGIKQAQTARFEDLHNSGYCIHTLQLAIYSLLHSESYEDGLKTALSLGGDSDTNGAITGALTGARFGLSAIPSGLSNQVSKYHLIASQGEQLLNAAEKELERSMESGDMNQLPPPPPSV